MKMMNKRGRPTSTPELPKTEQKKVAESHEVTKSSSMARINEMLNEHKFSFANKGIQDRKFIKRLMDNRDQIKSVEKRMKILQKNKNKQNRRTIHVNPPRVKRRADASQTIDTSSVSSMVKTRPRTQVRTSRKSMMPN